MSLRAGSARALQDTFAGQANLRQCQACSQDGKIPEVNLQAVRLKPLAAVLAGDLFRLHIAPMLALDDTVRRQHHVSLRQLSWVCRPLIAMEYEHLHDRPSNYSRALKLSIPMLNYEGLMQLLSKPMLVIN